MSVVSCAVCKNKDQYEDSSETKNDNYQSTNTRSNNRPIHEQINNDFEPTQDDHSSEARKNYQPNNYYSESAEEYQTDNDELSEISTNNQQNNYQYSNQRQDYHFSENEYDYDTEDLRNGQRNYNEDHQLTPYSGAHNSGSDNNQSDHHKPGGHDGKPGGHGGKPGGHGGKPGGHGGKPGGHDGKHNGHRLRKTRVKMPSGIIASITRPATSEWRCNIDKTKLIKLHQKGRMGREEYQIVANEMSATMLSSMLCYFRGGCFSSYKILKIQKIVNGCLWRKYRKYQAVVHKEVGYTNEKMLFHGSDKIEELLDGGFDERYSNVDGRFGAGIYFAQHSTKSNQYAFGNSGTCKKHNDSACLICVRQIFLCRVTLGKVYKILIGQKYAHPPPGYHSVEGTANITNPYPENIIYRGEQAYPEYLISYKIVK